MTMPINIYGSKVLRKRAEEVQEITPELRQFAEEMLETMYEASGIGLAAPQVGRSIRLIVVDVTTGQDAPREPHILFNPKVVEKDGASVAEEGCLSIPGVWADVERPEKITVEALEKDGKPLVLKDIDGMFARCIQHEIDHLDGVLFVDKISAMDRTLNQNKLKKLSKESKSVPA